LSKVRVTYTVKNIDDRSLYVLIDRSQTFNSFEEAIGYIKQIRTTKGLVGNPLVESI